MYNKLVSVNSFNQDIQQFCEQNKEKLHGNGYVGKILWIDLVVSHSRRRITGFDYYICYVSPQTIRTIRFFPMVDPLNK